MVEDENKDKPTEEEVNESTQEQQQENDLITLIRSEYEEKIDALKRKNAIEVRERDELIKQLLRDDRPVNEETIADRINARRNYKKW